MSNRRDIVLVSSGYDNTIKFWSDFNESNCLLSKEVQEGAINALQMSPDKKYLAYATGNSVKFIDLNNINGPPVHTSDIHEGLVTCILIPQFPSQQIEWYVSAGEDSTVRIHYYYNQKEPKVFYHSNYVNSLAIANNNNDIIAADESGAIKIWDFNSGGVRTDYVSKNEEGCAFRSIALAEKKGFLVGAKSSGKVLIFEYDCKKDLRVLDLIDAHKTYITKCVLSPEFNIFATCSADSEIKLWELKDKENKKFEHKSSLIGHKKWVWDCDFSLDSQYLISCSSDKTIKIWSLDNMKMLTSFNNNKGVNHIALADDDTE